MPRISGFLTALARALGGLAALLDLQDAVILAGLALATVGGMLLSVAWTLVLLGIALVALGVFAYGGE